MKTLTLQYAFNRANLVVDTAMWIEVVQRLVDLTDLLALKEIRGLGSKVEESNSEWGHARGLHAAT